MSTIRTDTFGSVEEMPALRGLVDEISKLDQKQKNYFARFFVKFHTQLRDLKKLKTTSSYYFFWKSMKDTYKIRLNEVENKYPHNLMTHFRCVVDSKFKNTLPTRSKRSTTTAR